MIYDLRQHWETIYTSKSESELSWHTERLETSLSMILSACAGNRDCSIIDVGGGTSRLVDDLIAEGFSDITLLDVSKSALAAVRKRLGAKSSLVKFVEADILTTKLLEDRFDVWHDRAVFHFLTKPRERMAYIKNVKRALRPGGTVVIGTFGPSGPEKCSGRNVCRYGARALNDVLATNSNCLSTTSKRT